MYRSKGIGRGSKKDDAWDDDEGKKNKKKLRNIADSKAYGNLD